MAEDWRLRDEQGNVRSLSTQELRDGLSRGAIPSSAQVARPGSEFKPAFSVPELATAAIRAKRTPSIPPSAGLTAARPAAPAARPPGGPKPVGSSAEIPQPARSRRRIQHTLVGIHGDEDGFPSSEASPIVAPSGAGGASGGAPRAITQAPRFTPAPAATLASSGEVVIPRAPRAPTTLPSTDASWDDETTSAEASLFDDDPTTLVKRGPRSQPPPLPPRHPPSGQAPAPGDGERPPMRHTVMGLGGSPGFGSPVAGLGGGIRRMSPAGGTPRLVPPKQASTPPPPKVRAVSAPPPVPLKRTPSPGVVAPSAPAEATSAAAPSSNAGRPAPPAVPTKAATPAPAVAKPASAAAPASARTPAPISAKAATAPVITGTSPAPSAVLPTAPVAPRKDGSPAPSRVEPAAAVPPVKESAKPAVEVKPSEGTPTVPMPEARESATELDEAPTSKMAVQVVHGAAMAMRAALAAPHPGKVGATPAPAPAKAAAAAAATPAPTEAAAAPLPPVKEAPPRRAKPAEDAAPPTSEAPASTGVELPLPPSTGVTLRGLGTSSAPPPSSSRPSSTSSTPPSSNEDDEDGPKSGVEVPVSSLFAASAVWIVGLVLVFFVGRCSALEARAPLARRGVAAAAKLALLELAPASTPSATEPKPCWVTRQPSRWAARASKNVPFDMVPAAGAMLVGYAESDQVGVGARIDPRSGKFLEIQRAAEAAGIGRLTPVVGADATAPPTFVITVSGKSAILVAPAVTPPLFVRFGAQGLDLLRAADAADGERIHPLEGDAKPNAEQLLTAGAAGVYASFRREDAILGAWLGADRKAKGTPMKVTGSGGTVGKPRAGWNGKQVAVVFADKPEGGRWQVRLGRASGGEVPQATEVFDLPAGGPGGDAIAPDIVGLADGRWLVMWTEGAAGSRAIRSLTLAADGTPIGDPIALSPPAGNYGQAQLGVVGGYVTVLFLQKGDEDFELWGAVLQCG